MAEAVFNSKAVIVTGASSGIGKAVALQLAAEGAWLALAARNAERLDAVVAECEARGGKAVAIPTDVTDDVQCQALIQSTMLHSGESTCSSTTQE